MSDFGVNKGLPDIGANLAGSILGEALKHIQEGVYVVPALGVDFVEPWHVHVDDGK